MLTSKTLYQMSITINILLYSYLLHTIYKKEFIISVCVFVLDSKNRILKIINNEH